jgi:hypothetical protein
MKIYSNAIVPSSVYDAFRTARSVHQADIYAEDVRWFTPRRAGFARGVELFAHSHNGTRASAHASIEEQRGSRDHLNRAASWDAYGYVIAYLYRLDAGAVIGPYRNREDFVRQVRAEAPRRRSEAAFLSVLDTADAQ